MHKSEQQPESQPEQQPEQQPESQPDAMEVLGTTESLWDNVYKEELEFDDY